MVSRGGILFVDWGCFLGLVGCMSGRKTDGEKVVKKVAGKKSGKRKVEWAGTQTANLVRRNGGVYYAQVKIQGKTYRRSLGSAVLGVARVKLPLVLNDIRASAEGALAFGPGGAGGASKATLRGCLAEWFAVESVRPDLLESSKSFNVRRFDSLVETLPMDVAVGQCGAVVLRAWWCAVGGRFNAQYANNLLSVVRVLVDMQVAAGLRASNPLADVKRMRVKQSVRDLPSGEEMAALIEDIRSQRKRCSEESADMVAVMAYTGMRPGEMARMRAEDIYADSVRVRGTKTYAERVVPIMDEVREVLDRRREMVGSVWSIKSPTRAMTGASERLGLHVTPYTCRHFFATRCLECDTAVPIVARWLGHKDGGVTLLKTYSHVTDKAGMEAAKSVRFA